MTDRFVSPCPPPTAHQREMAGGLIKQCAEVTQPTAKLLRFSVGEMRPGQPLDNKQRFTMEIDGLIVVTEFPISTGIADANKIEIGKKC